MTDANSPLHMGIFINKDSYADFLYAFVYCSFIYIYIYINEGMHVAVCLADP